MHKQAFPLSQVWIRVLQHRLAGDSSGNMQRDAPQFRVKLHAAAVQGARGSLREASMKRCNLEMQECIAWKKKERIQVELFRKQ